MLELPEVCWTKPLSAPTPNWLSRDISSWAPFWSMYASHHVLVLVSPPHPLHCWSWKIPHPMLTMFNCAGKWTLVYGENEIIISQVDSDVLVKFVSVFVAIVFLAAPGKLYLYRLVIYPYIWCSLPCLGTSCHTRGYFWWTAWMLMLRTSRRPPGGSRCLSTWWPRSNLCTHWWK